MSNLKNLKIGESMKVEGSSNLSKYNQVREMEKQISDFQLPPATLPNRDSLQDNNSAARDVLNAKLEELNVLLSLMKNYK